MTARSLPFLLEKENEEAEVVSPFVDHSCHGTDFFHGHLLHSQLLTFFLHLVLLVSGIRNREVHSFLDYSL